MIPWATTDWIGRLADPATGTPNYPELVELIDDLAMVYAENGASPFEGDACLFNDSSPVKIHQMHMGNMNYQGMPSYVQNYEEALRNERFFYHHSDPAGLVAWRTASGDVEIHWDYGPKVRATEQSDRFGRL